MKKRYSTIILFIFFLFSINICAAHHVKGGWIGYNYFGRNTPTTTVYQVTVYLYVDCHNSEGYTESIILGCFDNATQANVFRQEIKQSSLQINNKTTYSPCLINPPSVCYKVYTYTTYITLKNNEKGYDINVQFRARVDNIVNIENSGSTGITFFAKIPGNIDGVNYRTNSSPEFAFQDTSVVCHSNRFSLPFSATDRDGDSLSYQFGSGLDCIAANNSALQEPTPPPYYPLTYTNGFSGDFPLGLDVTINPKTGLISGTAPSTIGEYVIAVYVKEWRNGILLDSIKKELQINVQNCSLGSASLNPSYINCTDNKFTFSNNITPVNAKYLWDFGVTNTENDTSSLATPTFEYPDTGIYTLKLKVAIAEECVDSTTSEIKVYPGFKPDFEARGLCITGPTNFFDKTYNKNGILRNWTWSFGDKIFEDPKPENKGNVNYQYKDTGTYKVVMYVENSKGCSDTISHDITVYDKLKIKLLFSDTTICNKDSIMLVANADHAAQFLWSSTNKNISQNDISNPLVYPKENSKYQVIAENYGCKDTALVKVNILQNFNLEAPDQNICIGDTAFLYAMSQAQQYVWTKIDGSDSLYNNQSSAPYIPSVKGNGRYLIISTYGKNCELSKNVNIFTDPYPEVNILQNDTTICLGNSITLTASSTASNNIWLPSNKEGLINTVNPRTNTLYTIEAFNNNSYCQKKVRDSVLIKLVPSFILDMTKDTSVVISQPLRFNPITNYPERQYQYLWQPTTYLDSSQVKNPTALFPYGVTQQYYTVKITDEYGCTSQKAINVHIYNTATDIFVPSAFTPNGDGKNDLLRPMMQGIKTLTSFQVFNRWGQLVFATQTIGEGWNGYHNGQLAPSGSVYIYHIVGFDYKDKKIDKKGTTVLIR